MGHDWTVPAWLAPLRDLPDGPAWLDSLPARLAACAERWELRTGPPYRDGFASLAVPAVRADGSPAVLKLQYPDAESRHEADALAHWAGDGAVRLLAHDPVRRALLIERCVPGEPLSSRPAPDAVGVLVGLLPRLWRPAGAPFTTLAEQAAGWVDRLPGHWERAGRPFPRRDVDAILELLPALAASQGEQVLVNQDLHTGNVLAAEREPWLVIDPKPLLGEREFSVVPAVRGAELGHSPVAVRYRLDRLSAELGLDRERVRGWTVGQTAAWCFGAGTVFPSHVDVVRWLLVRD
ncbi:aminoglycoside phosphotransferase family protein [Micromonospora echinofusca]|uniref:Aminoglycoside phosphotransferase n=1 Tax=Micromonospora echinofusca TaxID=47858 RepID=A0ABS3VYB8_MICEH|nr:aminoglycoside phosphotransferase family protein [Micromonospora echinofusca]MBO4209522.1 aminoglycoside phosphotransferase [Micromonospora echinofusca]